MNYEFVEIHNPSTGHTIIVDEHSSYHWLNGYTQFVRYVPNSEIDIFEQDAIREDQRIQQLAESADDNLENGNDWHETGGHGEVYHWRPVEIY